MKKEYIAPAIRILPMEPSTILAASGGGYTTENGPGFGGVADDADDHPEGSLSKDNIWSDDFME